MKARKSHNPNRYDVTSHLCLGLSCFKPGEFHHGGPGTGKSYACMQRAQRGCPTGIEFSAELKQERKAAGWRVS